MMGIVPGGKLGTKNAAATAEMRLDAVRTATLTAAA